MRRRTLLQALPLLPFRLRLPAGLTALALLPGCASTPATQWYELRLDPPGQPPAVPAAASEVWELSPLVELPGALDRDTLMAARGSAGLQALAGHRWTEPLRDAVPRLLLHDLQRLRGADSTWAAPAPAGVPVQRLLRVQLLVMQADENLTRLRVAARWWLQSSEAQALQAPPVRQADFSVAIESGGMDALAAAHRAGLWELAQRIAQ